uniref:Putative secreted protein n=1 Tax=Amblyomma americanum TaxID=6943 RepID=A0A0C9R3I1_AMBAM
MQRYLLYAVIILICVHSLMSSVNGCNTKLRPPRKKGKDCLGRDCNKNQCRYSQGGCNGCVGSHAWCSGYCTILS